MRMVAPLIHNITNYVAMEMTANTLLAAGASPAMVHAREEISEFVENASALAINIGTLSPDWALAMYDAATAALCAKKPWVLDPVGVGATSYRRSVVGQLIAKSPAVVKGNASEILTLCGRRSGYGVDATECTSAVENEAIRLALDAGCIVVVTGPVDIVTDGTRVARVSNGHEAMSSVTAMGCSLTGIVAAFTAAAEDPFEATLAAVCYFGAAGEHAAETAAGPASFSVRFVDALSALSPNDLTAAAKFERLYR